VISSVELNSGDQNVVFGDELTVVRDDCINMLSVFLQEQLSQSWDSVKHLISLEQDECSNANNWSQDKSLVFGISAVEEISYTNSWKKCQQVERNFKAL